MRRKDRLLKTWLRVVALCAVSLLFLWLAAKDVDVRGLAKEVGDADASFLALSVVFSLGTLVVRAVRWKVILPPTARASYSDLFISTGVGLGAISLLPARLGELVRPYMLRARTGTSISTSLGSIVVERVLDLAAVLVALGIVLMLLPLPDWVQRGGQLLLVVDAAVFSALVWLNRYPEAARTVIRRSVRPFSIGLGVRLDSIVSSFVDGLNVLGRWDRMLLAMGWTGVLWALFGLAVASNLEAMHLGASWLSALTVLAVLSLGLSVPSGPGFVGTFEFFAVFSLGLLDIPRTSAVAFALVFHAMQLLPTALVGVVCLWASGLGNNLAVCLRPSRLSVSSEAEMESASG